MSTWYKIVCADRPDLYPALLRLTERLILKHIQWGLGQIAEIEGNSIEVEVDVVLNEQNGEEAKSRYHEKYLRFEDNYESHYEHDRSPY